MGNVLSPELVQLIEGFKPYLGNQGKSVAETALKIINAISSPQVREAYQEISSILPQFSEKLFKNLGQSSSRRQMGSLYGGAAKQGSSDEDDLLSEKPVEAHQKPGIQEFFSGNLPFILFLVLILLFFGDGGW